MAQNAIDMVGVRQAALTQAKTDNALSSIPTPLPSWEGASEVRDAKQKAWDDTASGQKDTEAGFQVVQQQGKTYITPHAYSNERQHVSWVAHPGIVAEFHVHGKGRDPHPSDDDKNTAHKLNVPITTMSTRGAYRYDPGTKKTIQTHNDLDWLKK